MIGTSLSHYQITGQLGVGGMGEVYRARDSRLGRDVAIKVLPVSFEQDKERLKRFEREARLLASLNHPHIASIHGFEQHEGKHFLVLELTEGETLDQRLRRGPMPLRETLEIGKQIAEALEAAHEKGIIHRDLKPGNINFTRSDKVKVLDFGLAKALADDTEQDATTNIVTTHAGSVMGTPAYMSPEQASGKAADAQSDIWSFGCILYECLTGNRMFSGKTVTECLSAVLQKEPEWERLPENTPPTVEQLLRKCLERSPRRRLHAIGDAVVDLENALGELRSSRAMKGRSVSTHGRIATLVIMAAALAAIGWWLWRKQPASFSSKALARQITSLAVKPLDDFSGDTNQAYLSDGMTEALCAALGNISALRVPGRSSVMRYKGGQKTIQEMGRELKVGAILEGSIQQSGNEVRITVQLIDASSDKHLWATNYIRDLSQFFKLQSEVAQAVADEIQVRLTPEEKTRFARVDATKPEVIKACLLGMHHWWRWSEDGLTNALRYFEKAAELDPNYAPAHAGAALVYGQGATWLVWLPHEAMPKSKKAAAKALSLDPLLADAYVAMGYARLHYDWDWNGAAQDFKRACELSPNSATALDGYAVYHMARGQFATATSKLMKALEMDPLSPALYTDLGWVYHYSGDLSRSIEMLTKAIELDHNFYQAHYLLTMDYNLVGKTTEALAQARRTTEIAGSDSTSSDVLGYSLGSAGRRSEALTVLSGVAQLAKTRPVSWISSAYIHKSLCQREAALDCLEKAYADRDGEMIYLKLDPLFLELRDEPRFEALVGKVEEGGREK